MSPPSRDDFGIVTMAAGADAVVRACALRASLAVHEPDLSVVALVLEGLEVPAGYFDDVVTIERPEPYLGRMRFLNKLVHPFALSPFERTLFLDDDILAVRPFSEVVEAEFQGRALALNTRNDPPEARHPGPNHLVPGEVCAEFGLGRCLNTNGGGHMYFERGPDVDHIVATALDFAADERYERLAGQADIVDELVLLLAVNQLEVSTPTLDDFVDAVSLRQASEIKIRVLDGRYEWPARPWGNSIDDVRLVHFCSNAKRSLPYAHEIHRLTGMRQTFDQGPRGALRRLRHRALSSGRMQLRRS